MSRLLVSVHAVCSGNSRYRTCKESRRSNCKEPTCATTSVFLGSLPTASASLAPPCPVEYPAMNTGGAGKSVANPLGGEKCAIPENVASQTEPSGSLANGLPPSGGGENPLLSPKRSHWPALAEAGVAR